MQSYEQEGQFDRNVYAVREPFIDLDAEAQRTKINAKTIAQNARIAEALNIATEQQLSADPKVWWEWWNKTNEIYFDGGKPIRIAGAIEQVHQSEQQKREQLARQERIRQELEQVRIQSLSRCDCLAPGAFAWTSRGKVAVESVQPGDMVLAQNIETGDVALKPVLRRTLRPETVLVKITVKDDVIEASGGHPFWVTGEGWVKARDLKEGMTLHGVDSARRVMLIDEGQKSVSHNLIVADFHSYFVGTQRILSHVNTVRRPTNAIVPGLVSH